MKITKKQLLIIATILTIGISFYYYLSSKNKTLLNKHISGVIYLPTETYTAATNTINTFSNTGINISNNTILKTNALKYIKIDIPKAIPIYKYRDLTQKEKQTFIKHLENGTGLRMINGYGGDKKQSISFSTKTGLISYTLEKQISTFLPTDTTDQTYLPQAQLILKQLGFDIGNYEYTTYAYQKNTNNHLITVNTAKEANVIKYTFERKLDGYDTYLTVLNTKREISIWIDSNGKMVKLEGFQFGSVENPNIELPTKSIKEIEQSIIDGSIRGLNGNPAIVGEKLATIDITDLEIIYSTTGDYAIPLVKLSCKVKTTNGNAGTADFITDLVNLNKINELNK